jgi:hypothetical protein
MRQVSLPGGASLSLPLGGGSVDLGRVHCVGDSSKFVSRRQCSISSRGKDLVITSLGTKNPTGIRSPGVPAVTAWTWLQQGSVHIIADGAGVDIALARDNCGSLFKVPAMMIANATEPTAAAASGQASSSHAAPVLAACSHAAAPLSHEATRESAVDASEEEVGTSSAKRPREQPEVIELSDGEADGEEDGTAPRIVIDLLASPRSQRAGQRGASSSSSAVIDLDAQDDASLAREMQAQFDVIVIDDKDSAGDGAWTARGGDDAIDFKALNAARQRRLAQRERLGLGGDVSADSGDLLHDQRRGLEARCAASAAQLKLRVTRLQHNAASKPGSPLYERFVAAWSRVPDKTLRVVFHATDDRNIDAICRSGLNPAKRGSAFGQVGGAGEYFGREVQVSAPYAASKGSRSMLVFAILMDRSGLRSMDRGVPGEIVIHRKEHQLPLAVVSFDRIPAPQMQLGPAWQGGMIAPPGFIADSDAARFPGQGRTLGGL